MHFTHALQTGEYISYAHSSSGKGQAGDLSKRLEKIQQEYDKQPSGFHHLPDLPGLPPLLVKHNLEAEVIPKLSGSEPIRRPLARIFTLLHFFNLYIQST